jgi:DinB family protein
VPSSGLREHVAKLLSWEEAHVSFDSAVANLPEHLRGTKPKGLPYSPWQLIEHIRIAQRDILEFCRDPEYVELKWPDDYWPDSPAPANPAAWANSIKEFRRDRSDLQKLCNDPKIDLESEIPPNRGQTYLRELLLVADHTAYHVGELVVLRRLLEAWPAHDPSKQ